MVLLVTMKTSEITHLSNMPLHNKLAYHEPPPPQDEHPPPHDEQPPPHEEQLDDDLVDASTYEIDS